MKEQDFNVNIPFSRVCELIEKSERIAAVERMMRCKYPPSLEEVLWMLNIKVKEDTAHEAI